jgi:hypothetical protein
MHNNYKLIERAVIGLVAAVIAVNILTAELPRLLPDLVLLAVVFVVVRLVVPLYCARSHIDVTNYETMLGLRAIQRRLNVTRPKCELRWRRR